jgi:hypothetical protein
MAGTEEVPIDCPYCGEGITVVVDTSVAEQEYVEDCPVCCRPIQLGVTCADGEVEEVLAEKS